MPEVRRERTLERFRSGRVRILVAAELAARDLDLVEITTVINFDPPADDTGCVHGVGRAGRAGRGGAGVTLVLPEQQADRPGAVSDGARAAQVKPPFCSVLHEWAPLPTVVSWGVADLADLGSEVGVAQPSAP
jgi:superfamily II DNA/RNA helicase